MSIPAQSGQAHLPETVTGEGRRGRPRRAAVSRGREGPGIFLRGAQCPGGIAESGGDIPEGDRCLGRRVMVVRTIRLVMIVPRMGGVMQMPDDQQRAAGGDPVPEMRS